MKENQPSYDKGGHYLRGQMDKIKKKLPDVPKAEFSFIQRRYNMPRPRPGRKP